MTFDLTSLVGATIYAFCLMCSLCIINSDHKEEEEDNTVLTVIKDHLIPFLELSILVAGQKTMWIPGGNGETLCRMDNIMSGNPINYYYTLRTKYLPRCMHVRSVHRRKVLSNNLMGFV